MPVFRYKALALNGQLTQGEELSVSAGALRELLAARGLRVQQMHERQATVSRLTGRASIKPEHFLLFNHEFTALLRAGLTLPEALKLAAERPELPRFGQVLNAVLQELRGGSALSDACTARPEVFDPLFISAVRTGERTGNLYAALSRYHDYLKRRIALRKRLSQAMAYPLFLLATLVVILAVLFLFVLPRFVAIYGDFNAELPWPTRVLIGVVDHLPIVLLVLIGLMAAAWFARRWLQQHPEPLARVQRWRERLPLLGAVQRMAHAAQAARALATLLASGTPLVDAMQTVQTTLPAGLQVNRMRDARQCVTEGQSLANAFAATQLMPATAVKMVQVGETSGSLDVMLEEIALFYEEQLDSRLAKLMTLLEPALMLLIGVFVGGIIVTMYLPIFSLAEVIK